jgi:hypothetical protein
MNSLLSSRQGARAPRINSPLLGEREKRKELLTRAKFSLLEAGIPE